jgi:GMP synthase (glutamine-hydrolysing)
MVDYSKKDKIIIIDFGSQVTKLIARRIRELKVYSEIITTKELDTYKDYSSVKGIILSGGPSTVNQKNFPNIPKFIFKLNIPILGICYGLQLIAKNFGGIVKKNIKKREFGRVLLKEKNKSLLTKKFFIKKNSLVWMSHQDSVSKMPKEFRRIASTKHSSLTIIENSKKKIYGIQFHPEVTHTMHGKQLFKNFIFEICKTKKQWQLRYKSRMIINGIRNKVKKEKVICALSGGVDSSVVALLIHKAIKNNLICIMVDTGLMRKNEFNSTYKIFKNKYKLNVKIINASKTYLKKLKKIKDPEKKEKL